MASFETIEEQRRELLDELCRWSPSRLAFQAGPAEWSAVQMLDHIIRTEREILAVVYSNESRPRRIGPTDRLRTQFLESVFSNDRRVKVPASAKVVLPGKDLLLPALTVEWSETRGTLAQRLDRLMAVPSNQALFRHPVGGWMSMQSVLRFFSVHLQHHGFQLQRIRTATEHLQAFPGEGELM